MSIAKINIKEHSGYKDVNYNFHSGLFPYEIDALINIIKINKVKKVFEFGTWAGFTAKEIAQHVEVILSIDKHIYITREHIDNLVSMRGDSKQVDFSPFKGYFDMVFIDGDHSYEGVKSDTENAFEMVKSGGVIAWHDYTPDGQSEGCDVVGYLQKEIIPLFDLKWDSYSNLVFLNVRKK